MTDNKTKEVLLYGTLNGRSYTFYLCGSGELLIVWGEGSDVTELGSEMSNQTTVFDGKEKGSLKGRAGSESR